MSAYREVYADVINYTGCRVKNPNGRLELSDIVPYSVASIQAIPRAPQGTVLPGQAQGVYIMFTSPDIHFFVNKMVGWFRDRDEVDLVDHGISDKLGCGYIILEWIERSVDQLFCDILRDEEAVGDYSVYTRDLN